MNTIAAIATPTGNAGIGIIRLSGPASVKIASKVFDHELKPRIATLGKITTPDVTDQAIVIYFPAPHSFTGEDIVELQAHGGSFLLQRILDHLYTLGATPATPGEFSKRAFLNGKLSLSQAEAIIDLINAESDAQLRSASSSFHGNLLEKLKVIEAQLTTLAAQIEVILDHPELDLPIPQTNSLQSILDLLATLIATENQGRLIANGVQIAVLGKPNVGKSSLFNALLGRDRAIVTNIAGTTTDTISESLLYNGHRLIFNDTAGIHDPKTEIERLGIQRSLQLIHDADICLVIFDASQPPTKQDLALLDLVREKPTLIVLSKSDLYEEKFKVKTDKLTSTAYIPAAGGIDALLGNLGRNLPKILTSSKTGKNIESLKEKIFQMVIGKNMPSADLAITNTRHLHELKKAHTGLLSAMQLLTADVPQLDLVAIDIAQARDNLGQISGSHAQDSVIDEIFSRFCLGK